MSACTASPAIRILTGYGANALFMKDTGRPSAAGTGAPLRQPAAVFGRTASRSLRPQEVEEKSFHDRPAPVNYRVWPMFIVNKRK
jgi:hypothetical protein